MLSRINTMSSSKKHAGFDTERLRNSLLQKHSYKKLLQTYSSRFPAIPNNNTGLFWDTRFTKEHGESVHHMEIDRNRFVSTFVQKNTKVLNLGSGGGMVENMVHQSLGNKVQWTGTDITTQSLNSLRHQFPRWSFIQTALEKLPFLDKTFDTIFLLEVLEHVSPHHTFHVLQEIRRVIKPNGRFIISVPLNEGLEYMYPQNPNAHVRVYSPKLVLFELRHAGFFVEHVKYLTAFPNMYRVKTWINTIFHLREANNMICVCRPQ
ncbi:MAG: methyltransferase domain-containing protein [Candidatus Pacebacteria bacterium]|nr:methyltransferase domain-containing protein [Candidatus Paceibacterota bacterium]